MGGWLASEQRGNVGARAVHLISGEGQRKIETVQKRSGVYPGFRLIGIAGWRLALVERLADAADPLHEGHRGGHVGTESTDGGSHKLEPGLDLGTLGLTRPEFWGINHS